MTGKLNIPHSTIFICQLPADTQDQIKADLEQHARENGYTLECDTENIYIAMSGRFCDIEDIYKD